MPRFLPDTSCAVPLLCVWHEHHLRAIREVDRRLDQGGVMVVAAPMLVETYAVLTRLPPPRRLSPAQCHGLLAATFLADSVEMVALDADACRQLLRGAPDRLIAGGSVYD